MPDVYYFCMIVYSTQTGNTFVLVLSDNIAWRKISRMHITICTFDKLLEGILTRQSSNAFTYTARSSAQLHEEIIQMKVNTKLSFEYNLTYTITRCFPIFQMVNQIFRTSEQQTICYIFYHSLATPVEQPSLAGLTHND